MSDRRLSYTGAALGNERRSAWRGWLSLGIEFLVLFAAALMVTHAMLPGLNGASPRPLWFPVIILSLQHGTGAGITAAVVASGLFLWEGLPPTSLYEDLYQYTSRVAAEPIGWTCAALLIGLVRQRQIRERAELQAELTERDRQCRAVADLCQGLRKRSETLERHIAADAMSSHSDIAEAICGLHELDSTNFVDRLNRFIVSMADTSEFSLYLLQDNELRIAIDMGNENRASVHTVIRAHDPLFEAVVKSRKTLVAARAPDRVLLDLRSIAIGPLVDRSSSQRVIGMLRIAGGDVVDFPEDIERNFALVCSEISRALERRILNNLPDEPVPAAAQPLERLTQAHSLARRQLSIKTDARKPGRG